jgi:hypothetical protein
LLLLLQGRLASGAASLWGGVLVVTAEFNCPLGVLLIGIRGARGAQVGRQQPPLYDFRRRWLPLGLKELGLVASLLLIMWFILPLPWLTVSPRADQGGGWGWGEREADAYQAGALLARSVRCSGGSVWGRQGLMLGTWTWCAAAVSVLLLRMSNALVDSLACKTDSYTCN